MIQFSYTFDPETRTLTPSGDPVNVNGDMNVVQIIFIMPASYEGLALSSYVWRVFYKIAMNTKLEEVRFHQFTNPTTEGENLVLTWTVTNSVTEFAGHLGFALSGTLTDTGGNVTNRINSIPAYERIEPTIGGGSYTEDDAEIEGIKDFLVGIQEAAEAAQAAAETAAAEAEASAARAEQIADELEPYNALAIVESASGDPATFTDGSNGVTMKSVSVDIDLVQDLHGYEYPWVGGAGKNLLDLDAYFANITQNRCTVIKNDTGFAITATLANGYTIPKSGKTREASVKLPSRTTSVKIVMDVTSTSTSTCTGFAYEYGEDGSAVSDPQSIGAIGTGHQEITYNIVSSDAKYLFLRIGSYESGVTVTYSNMMIINGTETDTSYAPYSNICPISGWGDVKVTRCGKNLFDPSKATDGEYINSDGEEGTSATFACSDYISVHGIRMVYFSGFNGGWGNASCYALYDKDKRKIRATHPNTSITSFPVTIEGAYYLRTSMAKVDKGTVMIEVGDTATSYEAYNGQTYPISLTSAGTVYGGTLDASTGELVVDRKMVDVGSLNWYKETSGTYQRFYTDTVADIITPSSQSVLVDIISDSYRTADSFSALLQTNGAIGVNTTRAINITDSNYSTANEFKTARKDVQIVYPLATPLTYTLTPTQITSLLGTNHVWADCGEVAVEYVADTKMYIDKIVASL